jgi:gamma-glutamylaminecyclotransferase
VPSAAGEPEITAFLAPVLEEWAVGKIMKSDCPLRCGPRLDLPLLALPRWYIVMDLTIQSARIRVFVYGTLLRGEDNHRFLRSASYLGSARTAPRFQLFDVGPFPALVDSGATAVVGELYEVDVETLAALDELEDHPDVYRRTEIPLDDGTVAHAYLLVRAPAEDLPVIASGDWRLRR